jgi:hypothetical protein
MKKWKERTNELTGISGVHFVVSELSWRGMIALPTVRNLAAYDIIVTSRNGRKHANIQVKTSGGRGNFFRMPPSHKIKSGPHDYYVVVHRRDEATPFKGFMLTGKEAKREVALNERRTRKRVKAGTRKEEAHSLHVRGRKKEKAKRWAKMWETWTL